MTLDTRRLELLKAAAGSLGYAVKVVEARDDGRKPILTIQMQQTGAAPREEIAEALRRIIEADTSPMRRYARRPPERPEGGKRIAKGTAAH